MHIYTCTYTHHQPPIDPTYDPPNKTSHAFPILSFLSPHPQRPQILLPLRLQGLEGLTGAQVVVGEGRQRGLLHLAVIHIKYNIVHERSEFYTHYITSALQQKPNNNQPPA